MANDPLEKIDSAARSEESAKQEKALELARELALAREFDGAEREIEPWLARSKNDPDDGVRNAGDPEEMGYAIKVARAIHDPASVVGLMPVSEFAGELPPPVLWMDSRLGGGTILREGDVVLLSGAGGSGKSFVSLALAVAAAGASDELPNEACGLHVRGGPAVVLSYEDDPRTVAWRVGRIVATARSNRTKALDDLALIPDPEPLMEADFDNPGKARESGQWEVVWTAIRSRSPSLVIVDPASAALAGVNQNDGATVRRFLRALAREAQAGKFGVLVVSHSTKAARYGQKDPGPDAVAGSGQWWDAARGVLFMCGLGPKRAVIVCMKSNHGPVGWAVELEATMRKRPGKADQFTGWRRLERYSPAQWHEKLREEKAKEKTPARKDDGGRRKGEEPEEGQEQEPHPDAAAFD